MREPRHGYAHGAAQGRSSLARSRWPDAQIEVAFAKWDLGKEQQREKREQGRKKREERREMVRSQKGGMVEKRVGPYERGGKKADRSEKRETSTSKMRGSKDAMVRFQNGGMVPNLGTRPGEFCNKRVSSCSVGVKRTLST